MGREGRKDKGERGCGKGGKAGLGYLSRGPRVPSYATVGISLLLYRPPRVPKTPSYATAYTRRQCLDLCARWLAVYCR